MKADRAPTPHQRYQQSGSPYPKSHSSAASVSPVESPSSASFRREPAIVQRSISACIRCRQKKIKCDQLFPSCTACKKASVDCVGVDAATGREIPRSYVTHLEDRVIQLEQMLRNNGILNFERLATPPMAEMSAANASNSPGRHHQQQQQQHQGLKPPSSVLSSGSHRLLSTGIPTPIRTTDIKDEKSPNPEAPFSTLGTYIGVSSGISFARLMVAAVKLRSQDLHDPASQNKPRTGKVSPASLPDKPTAERLVEIYFTLANPQIPILHRGHFLKKCFNPIYGPISSDVNLANSGLPTCYSPDSTSGSYRNPANGSNSDGGDPISPSVDDNGQIDGSALFILNMVFAIAIASQHQHHTKDLAEAYHAAAGQYMETMWASRNRLEALEGILLLSLYSIMRPAVPGVWYVLGVALRLCVDLGLHTEGGLKSWVPNTQAGTLTFFQYPTSGAQSSTNEGSDKSDDQFRIDQRRRLFWSAYAMDRQVGIYLGRPFGIPESAVKVPFPSALDDDYIGVSDGDQRSLPPPPPVENNKIPTVPVGPEFMGPAVSVDTNYTRLPSSSYKTVSLHMFTIRRLQTEIQAVLYDCVELPRRFQNLFEWQADMDRRLHLWHQSCPKSSNEMNCNFNLGYLQVNYQQSRLLLYGLSPAIPRPSMENYLTIAHAGQNVIRIYKQLHDNKNINYTWMAVHNLFMAGTSYLYSLYHCQELRAKTTIDEIDFNTTACIKVLNSLVESCDAAVGCRDTFELLTAAILRLCYDERARNASIYQPRRSNNKKRKVVPQNSNSGGDYLNNKHLPGSQLPLSGPGDLHPGDISSQPETGGIGVEKKRQQHHHHQQPPQQRQQQGYYAEAGDGGNDANITPKIEDTTTTADDPNGIPTWMLELGPGLDEMFKTAAEIQGISPEQSGGITDNQSSNNSNQYLVDFGSSSGGMSSTPLSSEAGSSSGSRQQQPSPISFQQGNVTPSIYQETMNMGWNGGGGPSGLAGYSGQQLVEHHGNTPTVQPPPPLPTIQGDGQRVYDMMFELPANQIWSQFFSEADAGHVPFMGTIQ